jgi:hypothetical protein
MADNFIEQQYILSEATKLELQSDTWQNRSDAWQAWVQSYQSEIKLIYKAALEQTAAHNDRLTKIQTSRLSLDSLEKAANLAKEELTKSMQGSLADICSQYDNALKNQKFRLERWLASLRLKQFNIDLSKLISQRDQHYYEKRFLEEWGETL